MEDVNSLFILKRQKKQSARGARKKQKSDRSAGVELMVLIEGGGINEIGAIVWDVTEDF